MQTEAAIPDLVTRTDPLIGCGNLLAFAERLVALCSQPLPAPLSLLFLDVNFFAQVNANAGYSTGDAVLRWIWIVLMEESQAPVFRLGGDEFVAVLENGTQSQHASLARRTFDRLNGDAERFGLRAPVAAVTVIHYPPGASLTPGDFMIHLGLAISDVKETFQREFKVFEAAAIHRPPDRKVLEWISNLMLGRIVSLGSLLDEAHLLAYTDPVTALPNMRAAERKLNDIFRQFEELGEPFSLLLVDGDDLRMYNKISYAAGDEMIRDLAQALNEDLRPSDFLARWRVGDEFLAILPGVAPDQAMNVADRLCRRVERDGRNWLIPVTISIGVTGYPKNGTTVDALVASAELAQRMAKEAGKNRAVAAPVEDGHA